MIKLSILIPVYNVSPYLRQCLDSLVGQSLKEIEFICVNDGSTDDSLSILNEYAAKDSRFVIIDKENGGYGKAMNVATSHAQGEYIGIVEPDDFVELNMFEVLYNKVKEYDLDFIKSDFYRFFDSKENNQLEYKLFPISKHKEYYNKVLCPLEDSEIFRFQMNTWNGIYKRQFLLDNKIVYNESPGASFQDNGFYFQTFSFAKRIMIIDQAFYKNRRNNPNSSVKSSSKVYAMNIEYDFIRKQLEKHMEIWQKVKGYYWLRKFYNYNLTIARISQECLSPFTKEYQKEFRRAKELGELDINLFTKNEKMALKLLDKNPELYYKLYLYRRSRHA